MKISTKLKKKLGLERAVASMEVLQDIVEIIDKDLSSTINRILDEPSDVKNWEHQIPMLIGEARAYRKIKSLLTIYGE